MDPSQESEAASAAQLLCYVAFYARRGTLGNASPGLGLGGSRIKVQEELGHGSIQKQIVF